MRANGLFLKVLKDAYSALTMGCILMVLTQIHGLVAFLRELGISPKRIEKIVGIVKAYTSRVGGGPLPTELDDEIGHQIREQGHEYGTTTGRPRRVGWIDLVNLKYACVLNWYDHIGFTLVDALGGFDTLKICVNYILDGKEIDKWPIHSEIIEKCTPKYIEMPGWKNQTKEEWGKIAEQGYDALPKKVRDYIEFIENYLGVPILIHFHWPES